MTKKNRNLSLRVGAAALAAGLGYVYHALSQERSLKSKLIEDHGRIKTELQKGRSTQVVGEQLQRRITVAKEATVPHEITARYNIITQDIANKKVWLIHGGEVSQTKPYLIYLHGGQRIDAMSLKEWYFIGRLAEQLELTIIVPKLAGLPDHTFAEESESLLAVLQALKEDQRDIYLLGFDTGAMYTLTIGQEFNQLNPNSHLLKKVVLISPWLDASLSNPELITANQKDYEQDLANMQVIQQLWQQKEPLVNMAAMSVDNLPPLVMISGTYDMHIPTNYQFYKRVRAKYPKTSYYRFDRMMHSFFLENLPESEEVMQLIEEVVKD